MSMASFAVLLVVVMKLFNLADFLAGGASKSGDAGRFCEVEGQSEGQSVVCISGNNGDDKESVNLLFVVLFHSSSYALHIFSNDLHFAGHVDLTKYNHTQSCFLPDIYTMMKHAVRL